MTDQSTNKKDVVLITGGSGLIGSKLAKLLSANYQVVGLDVVPNLHPDEQVENVGFDITDDSSIEDAFNRIIHTYGSKIASVIHLAAYYDFNGKDSPMYDKITVDGTKRLLKHLKDRFEVEQFFFSSTNLVYKPCEPGEKIDENWPLDPNWAYPESKVKTEKIIKENRGNIPAVIGRIAGAYDEWGNSIPLSHQIQRIYEKDLTGHLYSGDQEKGNPFIHLKDLIKAIKQIVDRRTSLTDYEVINISEGKTYSYGALQDRIGQLIYGKEWKTIEVPKPVAKAGATVRDTFGDPFIKPWMIDRADDHYELDISKAKEKLDWQPKHDLYKDLEEMINNLKSNPEEWYSKNGLEIPDSIKQES